MNVVVRLLVLIARARRRSARNDRDLFDGAHARHIRAWTREDVVIAGR